MIELGTLIQKPVLNVDSSCILGKVTDVYFDEYCKNAVYFCIATDSGKNALLPFGEIQTFSDALVVADGVALISPLDVDVTALQASVLRYPIYSLGGLCKGNVCDVAITSTGKVSKICTDKEEFAPSAILKIGDVILLKNTAKTKPRTAPKSRKIPRPKTDYPVSILDENISSTANPTSSNTKSVHAQPSNQGNTLTQVTATASDNIDKSHSAVEAMFAAKAAEATNSALKQFNQTTANATVQIMQATPMPAILLNADSREPVLSDCALKALLDGTTDELCFDDGDGHTPTRIICDYEFLLGRTLGADLCTYTGELIAAEGSVVSDYIVDRARRAGKLVELTLNSVKPAANAQKDNKQ